MMLNRTSLLVGLSLVMGIVFSADASAQTSDLVLLDDRNHYGQFSIDNVHVVEKNYYKVIFMDIHVKAKDLALEDTANVFWDSITLTNENGKKYQPEGNDGPDCKKAWDGTFYVISSVAGSDGGIGQHSSCYMVEKEFNNFKVYYTIPYYNYNLHSFPIGNVVLNEKNDPTSSIVSDIQNTTNHAVSNIENTTNRAVSNIENATMSNPQDFFTQFFEMLKNLFKFS
ncbi:MAG: hypothetical protein ACREBJ_11245 [Nitrosotalea sp.]